MPRLAPYEARRAARGCCTKCGVKNPGVPARKRVSGPAPSSTLLCRSCLSTKAATRLATAHRRIAAGACTRCGVSLINSTLLECARCRSLARYWWAVRNGRPIPEILPPRTNGNQYAERNSAVTLPKAEILPPRTSKPRPTSTPPQTLVKSAGTRPHQLRACAMEPAPGFHADSMLPDRPEKQCSNCRRSFAPTLRRRMLCSVCYSGGDGGPMAA